MLATSELNKEEMPRDEDHVLSPLSLGLTHSGGLRLGPLGIDSDLSFLMEGPSSSGVPRGCARLAG